MGGDRHGTERKQSGPGGKKKKSPLGPRLVGFLTVFYYLEGGEILSKRTKYKQLTNYLGISHT